MFVWHLIVCCDTHHVGRAWGSFFVRTTTRTITYSYVFVVGVFGAMPVFELFAITLHDTRGEVSTCH